MNIAQIEEYLSNLIKDIKPESFIYDLLLAYGLPRASITRLQKGNLNLSKRAGEVSWKKKVLFREDTGNNLHSIISEMVKEAKHDWHSSTPIEERIKNAEEEPTYLMNPQKMELLLHNFFGNSCLNVDVEPNGNIMVFLYLKFMTSIHILSLRDKDVFFIVHFSINILSLWDKKE